jgi:hypothetical protein
MAYSNRKNTWTWIFGIGTLLLGTLLTWAYTKGAFTPDSVVSPDNKYLSWLKKK